MAEPLPAFPRNQSNEPVVSPKPRRPISVAVVSETPDTGSLESGTLARDWYNKAAGQLKRGLNAASRSTNHTRKALRRLVNERPAEVIVAVAAISFLAGAALRIWRRNYE